MEQNLPEVTETDKSTTKYNYKVPKHDALLMALKGIGVTKIAEHYGVTHGAISQLLHKDMDDIRAYRAFKSDPATHYEYKESQIINNLSEDNIKSMSGYQKVGSAALIRDKVRLERGLVTSINASFTAMIQLQDDKFRDFVKAMTAKPVNNDV